MKKKFKLFSETNQIVVAVNFLPQNLMRIEFWSVELSVSGPETQSFSVQTPSKPKIPDKIFDTFG